MKPLNTRKTLAGEARAFVSQSGPSCASTTSTRATFAGLGSVPLGTRADAFMSGLSGPIFFEQIAISALPTATLADRTLTDYATLFLLGSLFVFSSLVEMNWGRARRARQSSFVRRTAAEPCHHQDRNGCGQRSRPRSRFRSCSRSSSCQARIHRRSPATSWVTARA